MSQNNTVNDPFSNQAGSYKKYRPVYPTDLYDFIFQHLSRRRNAWDCGTGSGQAAAYLADHFEKVYANDISRAQLDHAFKKENIHYFNKPAEDTGFPSRFFDLITVAQAIHWLDFGRFYEEVNRTAREDALIAVFGYGRIQTAGDMQKYIEQLYDNAFGKYYSSNRRFVEESYRSIPFPFNEIPAPQFEYHTRWSADELEGYFNTWSAVHKYRDEYGTNPVNQVVDEIKKTIRTDDKMHVRFPVFLRLGFIHETGHH